MNSELQSVVPRAESSLGSFAVWDDGQTVISLYRWYCLLFVVL